MRIVIVGQGAIGLLWYSKLSQQKDNRISLRCSNRVKSLPEQVTMTDINAVEHAVTLNQANNDLLQQAELVIFCVKAFDVCNAVNDIAALLPLNVPLILCHNGMINLADIDKKAKENHPFLSLLTTHGAKKVAAFHVRHTGNGDCNLGLTWPDNTIRNTHNQLIASQRLNIINRLSDALNNVNWCANIKQKQWLKLIVNCVINPLTAIEDIDNGEILSARFEHRINAIIAELLLVAEKENVLFNATDLKQHILHIAKLTANNSSSMRCDFLAKRNSEIDQINGYIVSLAAKHSVDTPINLSLCQHIKNLEKCF
jgi:2-dehydropantoate 2-reductase